MAALNITIAVLAAVTLTIAMQVAGVLMVSALMVVPVATAQLLTRSFGATFARPWPSVPRARCPVS